MAVDLIFGMIATERLLDIEQIRPQISPDFVAMQFAESLEEYEECELQREARLIALTSFHQEVKLLLHIVLSAEVNGSICIVFLCIALLNIIVEQIGQRNEVICG